MSERIHAICHPGMIKDIVIENEQALASASFQLGIVIPTFNRPEYLKYVFYSISQSNLANQKIVFLIFDDDSSETTMTLIKDFKLDTIPIIKIFSNRLNLTKQNSYTVLPGSAFPFTVRYGCQILFELGCQYVMNSDSDAMVSYEWLTTVHTTLEQIKDPYFILAGFRCQDSYHKVISEGSSYARLASLGGINMTFNKATFYDKMKDLIHDYSFDWKITESFNRQGIPIYLTKPSIVQHIGVHSSIIRGENNALSKCYDYTHEELSIDKINELNRAVQLVPNFPFATDYHF